MQIVNQLKIKATPVFYANKSDSTYTYVANANATVPMTWTTNDELQFVITYEAA